jgi:hypothetical protein
LVFPGRPSPTQTAFDLPDSFFMRVVDCTRLCVAPEHQAVGEGVWSPLIAFTWLTIRARGFEKISGMLTDRMGRAYQRLGLKVEPLAPARNFWGAWRFPALISPQP